ncbi:VOC family protein [Portibacter marinus]|uniref:VOC family protein n=1 Tax=Portibacter marinus TaxID=2898660 RepID=UPI001F166729|nr:VOC family protein [Portibacter marinus]
MTEPIDLQYIDHVAIRVKDLGESAKWYSKVLGLKKVQPPEWGAFPVFMMSKGFGVALFPANLDHDSLNPASKNVKIDHFAFHVNRHNFEKAIEKYKDLGLSYQIQDHYYFDSIYTKDPDGHTVELTTIKVDAGEFYKL